MIYGKNLGTILIFVTLVIIGCDKNDVPPLDEIIRLEVSISGNPITGLTLKADGKTQVKLVAKLPAAAAEGFRMIKFKSSAGSFEVTSATKDEQSVYAIPSADGTELQAVAYLTLGRSTTRYTVSAQIESKAEYLVQQDFLAQESDAANMINFEIDQYDLLISQGKLKADGMTKIKLIVSVPVDAKESERLVEFKSSGGTFDVTTEQKTVKQVTATLQNTGDQRLYATAYLTLGNQPGDYTLSAGLKNLSQYSLEKVIPIQPVKSSELLQVSLSPAGGVRADGSSLVQFNAMLSNTSLRKITFVITDGSFLNTPERKTAELEADAEGKVNAVLRVGTEVKDYLLTARLSPSIAVSTTFSPLRAHADQLVLESSALEIEKGSKPVSLDIFLKRTNGKVSSGTSVAVKSYQYNAEGQMISVGRYTGTNNVSDDTGKITVLFIADSGTFLNDKPIILEISTLRDDGTQLTVKTELRIKPS
jgi:hypothetical protein